MFAFRRVVSVTRLCLRYRLPPSYFIFHASCPKVGQFSRRDAFRLFLHFLVRSVENLMKTVKYRKIRNNIFDAITKKRRTSGKKRSPRCSRCILRCDVSRVAFRIRRRRGAQSHAFGRLSLIGAICVGWGKSRSRTGPISGDFRGVRNQGFEFHFESPLPNRPIPFSSSDKAVSIVSRPSVVAPLNGSEGGVKGFFQVAPSGFRWELLAEMHPFRGRGRMRMVWKKKVFENLFSWSFDHIRIEFVCVFAEDKESRVDYGRKLD